VGPCGSGKSTLVARLTALGYAARAVAQEHSIVRELWRHGGEPAALILLHAEPATITARRQAEFPAWLHSRQLERLATARAHADLVVTTDQESPETVTARVVEFLRNAGIRPAHERAEGPRQVGRGR
jgi:gluconate kinase